MSLSYTEEHDIQIMRSVDRMFTSLKQMKKNNNFRHEMLLTSFHTIAFIGLGKYSHAN